VRLEGRLDWVAPLEDRGVDLGQLEIQLVAVTAKLAVARVALTVKRVHGAPEAPTVL
jgi:hypothetical protein